MSLYYVTGVLLAILSGCMTQAGQLLQKKAVNEVRKHPEKGFMRSLLTSPVWIIGFLISSVPGSITYVMAQVMIGPALVPGLTASGLIVLAIGSVKMNDEELNRSEIFGIFLMIAGILFLGLSGLGIDSAQVKTTLADRNALIRITMFTLGLYMLFIITRVIVSLNKNRKSLFIAIGNGFLNGLMDFWINPLIVLIVLVLTGHGTPAQIVIFVVAAFNLTFSAIIVAWQSQVAFKVAQASNVIPVMQVPIQIVPILEYFYVFALIPAKPSAFFYIIAGTILTIIAGFLLGRRQDVPVSISYHPVEESNLLQEV